jgi:hypothetical protein
VNLSGKIKSQICGQADHLPFSPDSSICLAARPLDVPL